MPLVDWKVIPYASHSHNKMAFVCLDRLLANVSAVHICWCLLNPTTILTNHLQKLRRCFVVKNMPVWAYESRGLPSGIDFLVCLCKFLCCSWFHQFSINFIAVLGSGRADWCTLPFWLYQKPLSTRPCVLLLALVAESLTPWALHPHKLLLLI